MYRVAICDDEKLICECVENQVLRYARQHKKLIETAVFLKSDALLNAIEEDECFNLIFMDIGIKPIRGDQAALMIRETYNNYKVHIVFISGYPPSGKTLFESMPFDYLTKPFTENEVVKVLEKSIAVNEEKRLFTFKMRGDYFRIFYDQILYVESYGRKIKLVTKQNTYDYYDKFEERKACFIREGFVLIHRSILVNPLYIKCYCGDHVIMFNDEALFISRGQQKSLRERVEKEYEKEN